MRTVTYGMNVSIDGCYDHTKFNGDEELHQYFADLAKDVDLVVYGRKMYELMVPYWTEVAKARSGSAETNRFADTVVAMEKVVFSKTLESVAENTRLMRGGLEDEIRRLKQLPGGKISIAGMTLREELTALGLIDEFQFVIHPVIIGEGKKLMESFKLPENLDLKLVDCKILKSGCVALQYVKK